jgi:signal transduction histidine kinase/ActR/RegA family two-component response regulator
MYAVADTLRILIDWRADSVGLCAAMIGICIWSRKFAARNGALPDFSPHACVTAVVLALAGAALAEWSNAVIGAEATTPSRNLVLARFAILAVTGLAGGVLMWASVQFALLRAKLRAQADTERQLQQAKFAADEANRAKSDFLAVMSHEIRTPLNAVMGFAKLLSETRLDEAQLDYVSTITSEGSRLGSLINDILDLTKIEGGQLVLERLPFAPAEVAEDVLRLLAARAMDKKVELRFEAQVAGPIMVAGDPLRFRQILVNLVDNAIKFTPAGSVTLFLTWTPPAAGENRGRLKVRVLDTGIGIPQEKQARLFQMFMQVDSSTTRNYGGTGLGLAICQRLVTLMGGEISVSSARGQGSEFAFTLPLPPVALGDATGEAQLTEPAFLRPPRILVVDDLETNRFLLEVFLRRNGFEPALASGGEDAVRLAAANDYDAILMDLQMPGVDGYMATARIRAAEPPDRHTPIIALTASIGKGTREKCLAAGMDEHMSKPLDLDRFKHLLHSMIRARLEKKSP